MVWGGSGERKAARLRSVLIGLLTPTPPPALPELDASDWQEIDRLAALHRLRPLLHHHQQDNAAIPVAVRALWREVFRASAFEALQVAGELARTTALLQAEGLQPIALKGAWLAWYAYPLPGLRPMRDIDLWLPAVDVVSAYELLRKHGYRPDGEQQLSMADAMVLEKHLPPLQSPQGVTIELHQRLWEIDGRMDHAAPSGDETAIRDRAITIGEVTYLDPQDTLAHLIIHAVYDHRLDCGPLLLSDICFLLDRAAIDWKQFWQAAESGGWARGASLVLAIVGEHAPHLRLPAPPADCAPPVAVAAELMLQEPGTRQSAGVFATLRAGGLLAFMQRVFARRVRRGGPAVARDLQSEGGFAAWAGARLVRTVRDFSRRQVRQQARTLASLSRWLDS